MIAIKVGSEYLDLPQDTRIRIKLPSQLFSREFVSQGYSYPITLPPTPTNMRLMRFYHRIANTATFADIPCTIELAGNYWKSANIKYRRYKGGFDVDLQVLEDPAITTLGTLRTDQLQTEYELDLDLVSGTVGDMNTVINERLDTADNTPFIFAPIRNTGIFGDRDETYYGQADGTGGSNAADEYVNYYDADRPQPWLRYTANSTNPDRWHHELVPLPYLCRAVEALLDEAGLLLDGDVFRNEEVRSQVVVSNNHIQCLVGTALGLEFPFSEFAPAIYPTARLRDMLPPLTGIELLIRVCKRYNAVPLFRRGRVLAIRSLVDILNDRRFEDITTWVEPGNDMELETLDGLELTEAEEGTDTARLDEKYDPARIIGTVRLPSDLSSLSPTNGDYAVVEVVNKVYKRLNGNWVEWADYLPSVSTGTNATSIDVGVGFVSMWRGEDVSKTGRNWLVPHVQQKLSDPQYDVHYLGTTDMEQLRLLFYRGLQPDSTSDTYPLLSNDIYDYFGSEVFGATMREAIDGPMGIFERWYAPWLRAIQEARIAPKRVRIPIHRLRNWQWDKKLMIEGNIYLCREIDVEFTTTGMGVAQVELLRLPTTVTGIRLPINCAGRGHFTILVEGGTANLQLAITSGYLSYRMQDGIVTTLGDGSSGEQALDVVITPTELTPVCCFTSVASGLSTGDVTSLSITGGTIRSISTNYLADLIILDLSLVSADLVAELVLSDNSALQQLVLGAYPFPSIDLGGTALTELIASGAALTSLDASVVPQLSSIDLSGCAFPTAAVDSLFNQLYANAFPGGTIDISGGTNAAPTAASDTARTWLLANGWSITTN
jgi:hypothetical protein